MNSRMNFGNGFSIPQEIDVQNRDHWMPLTPEKLIASRSSSIPVEKQGNQIGGDQLGKENWKDLMGIYTGVLQETTDYNGLVSNSNPIGLNSYTGGSYSSDFNQNVAWNNNTFAEVMRIKNALSNGIPSERICVASEPTIPNLHSQVDSNWVYSNYQNCPPISNRWINGESLSYMPKDGFPVPSRPNYNLNSPPRSEADATSSVTTSFPFAPVTPDQVKQFQNHTYSEKQSLSVDESSSQEKDKQEDIITYVGTESIGIHCDELLQSIVYSSSVAISTPSKEKNNSDHGGDQGIDLNKTPQQKPPKRRKHRPKVVLEGKPKRAPKSTTPKNTGSTENPSGKRKYVRKNGLKTSETQPPNSVKDFTALNTESATKSCRQVLNFDLGNETRHGSLEKAEMQEKSRQPRNSVKDFTALNTEFATKSCRRGLNFDLGNETRHGSPEKAEMQEKCRVDFNLNLDPLSMGLCSQIIGDSRIISPFTEDIHQAGTTCTVNSTRSQMPVQCVSNAAPIGVNMRTSIPYRNSGNNGYIQGNDQRVFQTNTCENREVMWQSKPQLIARNLANCDEKRGSKREYSRTRVQTHSHTENLIGCLENRKRKKSETGFHATMGGTPFTLYDEDSSRQGSNRSGSGIYKNGLTSLINSRTLDSHFQGGGTSKELNTWVNDNSQKQVGSSELQLHSDSHRAAEKRSGGSTQVYNLTSQTATSNLNLLSSNVPNSVHTIVTRHTNMSAKKQATNEVLLQEHKEAFHGYELSSVTDRGPHEKKKNLVRIDVLIKQMNGLKINGGSNEDQKALVPYKGHGIMVEYKGLDHIKKRKPRPKVDLDPETNRIWNLLMGKEGNEGIEVEDKDKWWEEERKVFRGRADSFIARMHLVQGDRRFSQWKGSVVDSVIGVFLTQNVSDHLSSSAFMSLAARFPLSTTTNKTDYQTGNSIFVDEPEVQILEADATINYPRRTLMQQEHSLTSHGLSEQRKENPTPEEERTSLASENHGRAKEILSSQYCFGPFPLQPNKEIRSFLGSNSEAEYPTSGYRPENICGPTPKKLQHAQKTTSFQEFYSHAIGSSLLAGRSKNRSEDTEYYNKISILEKVDNPRGSSMFSYPSNSRIPQMRIPNAPSTDFQLHMTPNSGILGEDSLGLLGEKRIASLPQSASGIANFNNVDHTSRSTGLSYSYALLNQNPTRQESGLRPVPHSTKDQLFINTCQQESSRTFQLETTVAKEPTKPSEAMARTQTGPTHQVPNVPNLRGSTIHVRETISTSGKWKTLENKAGEANSKEQVSSSVEAFSEISPNVANGKKGKTEGEKGKSIDWDSLRRNAQPNGRTKQRSKDSLDSLDYEAVRCAEVNEISAAIKERGMNNMLAERIKDFLNRLVREHGSIDLEWLRDVPPDKVKDYLLSVRGLGLKSVECVRLLSLRHLAFPVDTNVGRIAVRLGWVPLQPLPESLQLHLLEMYPMLESIQKYLWPRLCKLDQRTLYELHYQMITFGKVFCTKSKPNCNACPMRGECRHFASAFASARLALPGPEDRSIVNSSIPMASHKNHTVMIKPMPLPPPDNNTPKESGLIARPCEPIVEEPTTPELESIEVTASDIEEAYYEDADEIPTIKLNIEEFTMNLHNYMQENMELQEGDMSNALVALNQEVASIPAPKLKNVSRLRTEHQVYELPDSHLLLKGLDQREPDDPSPYLLAIWTPGETANSFQPPERSCGSQESGKFCGEKTCFSCSSIRESNAQTVRGTILIPCRTAMRGSFPLNGTYFQVNEMFADHESSLNPIDVPRAWIWNLPRRTVYFGTSVTSIFKGLSTEGIQYCFWRGFVCVRGFDQKLRAPRPLMARLHFPASKLAKTRNEDK